jgi:hypothetical protein
MEPNRRTSSCRLSSLSTPIWVFDFVLNYLNYSVLTIGEVVEYSSPSIARCFTLREPLARIPVPRQISPSSPALTVAQVLCSLSLMFLINTLFLMSCLVVSDCCDSGSTRKIAAVCCSFHRPRLRSRLLAGHCSRPPPCRRSQIVAPRIQYAVLLMLLIVDSSSSGLSSVL